MSVFNENLSSYNTRTAKLPSEYYIKVTCYSSQKPFEVVEFYVFQLTP